MQISTKATPASKQKWRAVVVALATAVVGLALFLVVVTRPAGVSRQTSPAEADASNLAASEESRKGQVRQTVAARLRAREDRTEPEAQPRPSEIRGLPIPHPDQMTPGARTLQYVPRNNPGLAAELAKRTATPLPEPASRPGRGLRPRTPARGAFEKETRPAPNQARR